MLKRREHSLPGRRGRPGPHGLRLGGPAGAGDPQDLGDTTVSGTSVHHEQITLDKTKALDQVTSQQARDLMHQALQYGTIRLEAWIGVNDHLLRPIKEDTDASVNLTQLLQALGSASQLPPGSTIPADATVTRPPT